MAIYGGIYGPHGSSNRACIRAYIGHVWEQQWGMHTRIHGHIWGHTWATWEQQWGMHARIYGHIWGSPIGRAGRKRIIGNPFPSLIVLTPSLPY